MYTIAQEWESKLWHLYRKLNAVIKMVIIKITKQDGKT